MIVCHSSQLNVLAVIWTQCHSVSGREESSHAGTQEFGEKTDNCHSCLYEDDNCHSRLTEAFHHHTKLLLALIPSVLVGHIASKFHYRGVHIPSQGIGELKWLSPKNQYLFPRDFLSFEIYFITIMLKTTRSEGKKEKKYLGCFFSFY